MSKLWNSPYQESKQPFIIHKPTAKPSVLFKRLVISVRELADHDKNLNQRQIDETILKFLMTYRRTPHSGTEMSPSYLMLNRQIKNVFDLLRTKTSKIEIKNLQHQDQNCKAVSEYTEGEPIHFRNYNSQNKWEKGIVQKKLGSFHYLIIYNDKVVKKHLDQLRPN